VYLKKDFDYIVYIRRIVMKNFYLVALVCVSTLGFAHEACEQGNDWRTSYTQLESQVQKATGDQDVLKGEISHYKELVEQLTQQNHELLSKIQEKEGKEFQLRTLLTKLEGALEKIQGEMMGLDEREVQQKSRYQALNARVDNLSQQLDEVQRQLSTPRGKKEKNK
jgi:chromosome segregation ATPase